jgi:L-serine/L-threonine ammonia-lyase
MQGTMHIDTPLFQANASYSALQRPLLFKMDALQPTGSFKLRGVGFWCARAVDQGAQEIVCSSGGNAGISAAYAAAKLGVAVTVVVPETTSSQARAAIERHGAAIRVHGSSFDHADEHARELAARSGAFYLHPFNDPILWEGHATLIDEAVAAGAEFDCVITSVGGGGLLAGIVAGLERNGLSHLPVIAVETAGAASFYESVVAKRLVTLPAITSIATSLGARRVMQHVLDLSKAFPIINLIVTDADAVAACLKFADYTRVLVEPACGAALAVVDVHSDRLLPFNRPLIEICGGCGTTLAQLARWKQQFDL